jgi:hypothetical protein
MTAKQDQELEDKLEADERPIKSCGFIHVRPVAGQSGRYVCSICREVLHESYQHELPDAMRREVDRRKPIDAEKEAP